MQKYLNVPTFKRLVTLKLLLENSVIYQYTERFSMLSKSNTEVINFKMVLFG